jgi:hypothetical protein
MPDADLARAREGATDAPLPHRAPGPKDDSTCSGPPPTREAEPLTPDGRTRHAGGTFPQIKAAKRRSGGVRFKGPDPSSLPPMTGQDLAQPVRIRRCRGQRSRVRVGPAPR